MSRAWSHFQTKHDDFIVDVAYDYYGKRIATCSTDQHIKIWDQDAHGEWQCSADMKTHVGSIHRLTWAHPEFGQVIASCSSDRTVNIYEEQIETGASNRIWRRRAQLSDARDSVSSVAFAPRHLGLRLVTGSLDGHLRMYEAYNIMNLAAWSLTHEFEASPHHGRQISNKQQPLQHGAVTGGLATCVAWNESPFDAAMLASGCGADVNVWRFHTQYERWTVVCALRGHTDTVRDVAWAPNLGRSYHYIATACKDRCLRIFKVTPTTTSATASATDAATDGGDDVAATAATATEQSGGGGGGGGVDGGYDAVCVAVLDTHRADVWRCSWNVTGTMLASTGDDGAVRLWKADMQGGWHCASTATNAGGASPADGAMADLQN